MPKPTSVFLVVRSILTRYRSNLEFFHNLRHALKCRDAGRHQRQAQHILNESHFVQHGFDTCRIAIDKKQREQVRKTIATESSLRIPLAGHCR